jgi:hypothetical protein
MLLAAALVWALPALTARAAQAARRRPAWTLLAGFVALVAVPAGSVVLAVTLIGLPLAAIVLLAYLALLLLGYVASGIALGDAVLSRWRSSGAGSGWRAGAAALGVLLLGVLTLLPWVGAMVAFLTLIAGMGALVLAARTASAFS